MLRLCLLLALTAMQLPVVAADKAVAGDPGPAEIEVLDLYVNRHRCEPTWGDGLVSNALSRKQLEQGAAVSRWTFATRDIKAGAPLVFNPALVAAARAVLASDAKPVQATDTAPDAGKPVEFATAFRAAGYPEGAGAMLLARDRPSLELAYCEALAQIIGGRQQGNRTWPVFARTVLLDPRWRELGVAVAGSGSKWSLAIALGPGSAKRYAGGLVFSDANRDGRCDRGEGVAGITVAIGTASTRTGAAGAWWLALDSDAAGLAIFTAPSASQSTAVAAGAAPAILDWRLPVAADCKTADRLLAEAEKAAKGADPERIEKAAAALLAGSLLLCVDADRQRRIEVRAGPLRERLDKTRTALLTAMQDEATAEGWKKKRAELQKPWKSAIPEWFREIDAFWRIRQQATEALAAPADRQARLIAAVQPVLHKAIAEAGDPVLLKQLTVWRDDLAARAPAAEPPAPRGKGGR